jgi:hypothetical protein
MRALFDHPRARRALLTALACAALAALVFRSRTLVHAPSVVALTLALAALATLFEALTIAENSRPVARTIAAATRAASALILCTQWASEARELWGAITVAVVWSDARDGVSEERPLVPLGVGLAWAIAWSALRPTDAVPRVAAVAAIAAFGLRAFTPAANEPQRPPPSAV